jgi:uncharacterized delta-60 repeat protein
MRRWHHLRAVFVAVASLLLAVAFEVPSAAGLGGDLDPSFGDGGRVITVFPGGSDAHAVAIQPDGRIVVVGAAAGPSGRGAFAVARYELDGTLDAAFGDGGTVTTSIAGGGGEARSVAIQPDGRIVVAGTDRDRQHFAVVRYRANGALDPSFGGNGIVRTNFPGTPEDVAYDLAIQPDGKIVAVGAAGLEQMGFQLVRYRRDGSLDPGFGTGGRVVSRYHGAVARSVALQANGRIVVAGYQPGGLALARYRPNGRLDRSFAGNGMIRPGRVPSLWALAVTLQRDGRIVVGGDQDIFNVGLARFRPDGRLDPTFGDDGVVTARMGSGEQALTGVAVQPNGRIVAVGYVGPHEFGDPVVAHFVLVRCRRSGVLDPTFGADGKIETYFEGRAHADGVALQSDGRIVAVGGSDDGTVQAFALAGYLAR